MISPSLPVIVSDSAVSRVANKRTLVKVSLTLERIALASAYEATVVSLFQRAEYFDRMISTYRALADAGATVITAYAGEHRDIPSVTHIPLDVDEPLADEWDLIVLTPTFGAFVVAHDLDQFDTTQSRLEDGRTFAASWGFDRLGTAEQLARLSDELGPRMSPYVAGQLAAALMHAHKAPVSPAERAFGRAALKLTDELDAAHRQLASVRARLERETTTATCDPLTGLSNREGLSRWMGGPDLDGVDTLTIGIVMIDLDHFKQVNDVYGHSMGDEVLRNVADALRHASRPGDFITRWGGDEFVVACPGADGPALTGLAQNLISAVGAVAVRGVSVGASAGTNSCRRRPLAIDEADAAMFVAKKAGGRRVVAHTSNA